MMSKLPTAAYSSVEDVIFDMRASSSMPAITLHVVISFCYV